jgi:hypothetical protein
VHSSELESDKRVSEASGRSDMVVALVGEAFEGKALPWTAGEARLGLDHRG